MDASTVQTPTTPDCETCGDEGTIRVAGTSLNPYSGVRSYDPQVEQEAPCPDCAEAKQLPALKGNKGRSPDDLEGAFARAFIALKLDKRAEEEGEEMVPGMPYVKATGALLVIARDAIAVAKFQRDLCEDIRRHALELEERIAELEGEDDGDFDYRANLDNTRGH